MKKFIIFLVVVVVLIVGFILINGSSEVAHASVSSEVKTEKETLSKKDNAKEKKVENKKIKVDIKGNVVAPGVYEIDNSARVIDVINIAGGITDNADTDSINLSKIVKDEDVVIIYSKEDMENNKRNYEEKIEYCKSDNNDACIDSVATFDDGNNNEFGDNSIVNINTASIEDLMNLSGIGESKAKNIIEYRESNGHFTDITDIKNVKGIGDSIFDKIKDHITV